MVSDGKSGKSPKTGAVPGSDSVTVSELESGDAVKLVESGSQPGMTGASPDKSPEKTPSAVVTASSQSISPQGGETAKTGALPEGSLVAGRGPALFKPNPGALAELAISTSVVIATVLAIPDAFSLIPNSTSLVSWALRLMGVWIAAAVIWFISFLIILHVVRLIVSGIQISDEGIKLWRFAKLVRWSEVDSMGVERQVFFSKVFRLSSIARRLTIFQRKKARDGSYRLVPHYLPSFYFSQDEFRDLCLTAYERCFRCRPDGIDLFMSGKAGLPGLQKMFGTLTWQRMALSVVIALGLTFWLSKKAMVLYSYNSGNHAMAYATVPEARDLYKRATEADPTYAPAWFNLANTEYLLGDAKDAEDHWQRAIQLKPDFVEPRISLAHLAIQRRQYDKARDYIDHALMLNTLNPQALLNRAELEMNVGDLRGAMQDARIVLAVPQDSLGATEIGAACVLARAKLRYGKPLEAQSILRHLPPVDPRLASQDFNMTRRLIIGAQIALALNQRSEAEKYFRRALAQKALDNMLRFEALLGLAELQVDQRKFDDADKTLHVAQEIVPQSPWPPLLLAQMELNKGHRRNALTLARQSVKQPGEDSVALVQAGNILLELGQPAEARICAQRALVEEPDSENAKNLLVRSGTAGSVK
ncbi:MAG TPA: tetratricopeptide repeat protein [Planktothrix sp.]